MSPHDHQERLDRATAERLARLAKRPVDLSQLEQCVSEAIQEHQRQGGRRNRWVKPVIAIAASLLLVAIGWIVINAGNTPETASPAGLAEIHYEASNKLTPHIEASSVDEANRLLAEQSDVFHPLPPLPGLLKYCCLHRHANTVLTCAIIEVDSKDITVAIASASEIKSPPGESVVRGGRTYRIHSAGGTNLVMVHDGRSWLCVMGEDSTDQLISVADGIQFR